MKKTLITIAAALALGTAFAGGDRDRHPNHGPRHPGQHQAQGQGQSQSAIAVSGALSSSRATGGSASQAQTNAGNSVNGGNTTLEAQPATAFAAPLTTSNGTCMGSSSGGVQGGIGVSFGTTWTDAGCSARYDAEALRAAGRPVAALARLCQTPEIARAMDAAGTPCPKAKEAPQAKANEPTDPYVRRRLGLAPLGE